MATPPPSSANGAPTTADPYEGDFVPPHDLAAEQSVLGAMMWPADVADVVDEVMDVLAGRDFYHHRHAAIFNAIVDLYGQGHPTDSVTVWNELERRGEGLKIGGAPYLHTCIYTVPTPAHGGYYAKIVAEKAVLRRLIAAGMKITQLGINGAKGADIEQVVERAQAAIHDATTMTTRAGEGLVHAEEAADEVLAYLNSSAPRDVVLTGLTDLDKLTGGMDRGELVVVSARPGHGKSLLATQMLKHAVLKQGLHALLYTLEMKQIKFMQRLLASIPAHGIEVDKLRRKEPMTLADEQNLSDAIAQVKASRLYIDHDTFQTTATITSKARRHVQREGAVDLIVIDYGGLLSTLSKAERRDLDVSEITRSLKLLAGQLNAVVVLLWQLNRSGAQRADPRPVTSDHRDGGSVEQDAAQIFSIYSPAADLKDGSDTSEIAALKNRMGEPGRVEVAWQPNFGRFANLKKTP